MATAKDVMELAASFLGTKEEPAESNNVIFNTHYYGRQVSGGGYPWCCAFVWDVFRLAGGSSLFFSGGKTAYCPAVQQWGRKAGLDVERNRGRYGDIALFDWNGNDDPDHIGFVERQNPDGSYVTIEGNTAVGKDSNGGAVLRRVRSPKQICCMLRPAYEKEVETVRYEKMKDVREPVYRETLEKLVSKGFLEGKGGSGEERILDFSEDAVRLLVILDRAGNFG